LICKRPQELVHASREGLLNKVSNRERLDLLNKGMVNRRYFHTSSSSQIRGKGFKRPIYSKNKSISENPGEKVLEQVAKKRPFPTQGEALREKEDAAKYLNYLNNLILSRLEKNI